MEITIIDRKFYGTKAKSGYSGVPFKSDVNLGKMKRKVIRHAKRTVLTV